MDWIRKDFSMHERDVRIFNYDEWQSQSHVIKILLKNGSPKRIVDKNPCADQDWIDVIDKESTAQRAEINRNGLMTIIAPRREFTNDGGFQNVSTLLHLAWSKSIWGKIRNAFFVHGSIAPAINRNYAAQFSSAELSLGSAPAIIYNCRSGAKWKGDIALSVTYFPEHNFSYSIFYGCDKDIQKHVANRLENSEDVLAHPLLLPGIFAEEERLRQKKLIKDKLYILTKTNASLNDQRYNWAHMNDIESDNEEENKAVDIWLETYELKSGLENWVEQLEKMIAQCDFLEEKYLQSPSPGSAMDGDEKLRETMIHSGRIIKERLKDIIRDYSENTRQCEMIMEGLTLATQMAHTRANMEIAVRTKLDSSQMRSIALLTMIFLPATFAATLFSMGFFEWQPEAGQVVVSPRIWIYAVVAGGLTLLTVGLWYGFVVRRLRDKRRGYGGKVSYDEFDD